MGENLANFQINVDELFPFFLVFSFNFRQLLTYVLPDDLQMIIWLINFLDGE